jgi:hypothetical protein
MSTEDFRKMYEIVLRDTVLQKQLQAYTDRDEFIYRLVEMGREKGLGFSAETVAEAMRENRRVWVERWI